MFLKSIFKRSLPPLLLAGIIAGSIPALRGQEIGSSVVTAALGVPENYDTGDSPAVYITWWPTGDAHWNPGRYAIYSKNGTPDSPETFTLAGIVQPLIDPVSAGVAIGRSARLGQDLQDLSDNIDALFDKLIPTAGMTPAEKIAAIIDVSHIDHEAAESLALLTRRHPAIAMAAGTAFLDPIPQNQTRTYEIRSCPPGTDPAECTTVAGRVIVTGGEVHYLPEPGQPVHIPFLDENGDPDPRGNLNVPLRWATPNPLRERSFHQFGYDVFRVDAAFAESKNWNTSRPNRADFLENLKTRPDRIQQVNNLPVLTDQLFSTSEAADLGADPDSFFIIDDNGRYEPNGEAFNDGDQFYYFVAGRDLLNRPGEISKGTKVIICFRIPPESPRGLKVTNHYTWNENSDTQKQVLKLEWNPAKRREGGPEIAGYWIYRWESIEQMHQMQGLPFSGIPSGQITGGRIATVPAGTTEFIDNSGPALTYNRNGDLNVSASHSENHGDKTYWYTVRAIDAATCGGNLSGNSAPAYGVLRDRIGPEAPEGSVAGNCTKPVLELLNLGKGPNQHDLDPSQMFVLATVNSLDPEIEWLELFAGPLDGEEAFLGRTYFTNNNAAGLGFLERSWFLDQQLDSFELSARVGTADGKISELVTASFEIELDPKYERFPYMIALRASIDREGDCDIHEISVTDETTEGRIEPVMVEMLLPPKTKEWKLYRRIGNGSLTLLKQGIDSYESDPVIEFEDYDLPLNGGRICYFLQVFDLHGNPSIMKRLDCITAQPRRPLPQPMLAAIQPLGDTPDQASARIRWFSPPEGIERFQLAIRGPDIPGEISIDARPDYPVAGIRSNFIYLDRKRVRGFVTGKVGSNIGNGPEFSVHWTDNLFSGNEYFVRVRALGPAGSKSKWSNEESFIWTPEVDFSEPFDPNDCVVPWPVRGLPEVNENFALNLPPIFDIGLKPVMFPKNTEDNSIAYQGGGVRIGLTSLGNVAHEPPLNWDDLSNNEYGLFALPPEIEEDGDLLHLFYKRRDETSLLNFMLYRYQVPNPIWPKVSGDVYQVSPLIERIVYKHQMGLKGPILAIHDPYFFLLKSEIPGVEGRPYDLYVKDTQPVIEGATYRYLIVRFDNKGEIAQVIPLPPVTATAN